MIENKLFDLNAPIIPGESLGGIKIGDTYNDLLDRERHFLIGLESKTNGSNIIYKYEDAVSFIIKLKSCRVENISASTNYKGSLMNKIKIGSNIDELKEVMPILIEHPIFDGAYYNVQVKGIHFHIDSSNIIWGISIYDPSHEYYGKRE